MYKITIKVDTKELTESLKKELEMCMTDFVLDMKNDATSKAYENPPQDSVRTGQLGSTMKADVKWHGSKLTGKVSTHVEYAEYCHYALCT